LVFLIKFFAIYCILWIQLEIHLSWFELRTYLIRGLEFPPQAIFFWHIDGVQGYVPFSFTFNYEFSWDGSVSLEAESGGGVIRCFFGGLFELFSHGFVLFQTHYF